jgi:hypothetical protein
MTRQRMGALLAAALLPTAAAAQDPSQHSPKLSAEYRTRAEDVRGAEATASGSDLAYLTRLRLTAAIPLPTGLLAVAQLQDARPLSADGRQRPAGTSNDLDLRQGYLEVRRGTRWIVRAGRQELTFGDQRLIGSGEWFNVGRTFDGARTTFSSAPIAVTAFGASVVRVRADQFDRFQSDERLAGALATVHPFPGLTIEPYLLWRAADRAVGERGIVGTARLYALGTRVVLAHAPVAAAAELVLERGRTASQPLAAAAGTYRAGWTVAPLPLRPRIGTEFSHASGDRDGSDGRLGTFDQLYPTNHAKYGLTDRVGWRNMRDMAVFLEVSPRRGVTVKASAHRLWLATVADAWYGAGGAPVLRNSTATSRTLGTDVGVAATWIVSSRLALGLGMSQLHPGAFLQQSGVHRPLRAPHASSTVTF